VSADFTVVLRRIGTAVAVGVVVGAFSLVALTVSGSVRGATETTFSVGTLVLGFGVLGWSGAIMAGRGMENLQRHLDTDTNWTESDSRRAMARITGFGLGLMVSASFGTVFL
jgi:hypothetical protein